jgi:hypothetical protein
MTGMVRVARRGGLLALVLALGMLPPPTAALAQVDSKGARNEAMTLPEVRSEVDLMLLHLNDALFALSGYDVRVTRSQFKQFFDHWDAAEEQLSMLYPERYEALELELERAQNALLGQFPEDTDTARFALRALRAGLLEIVRDLEARSASSEPLPLPL